MLRLLGVERHTVWQRIKKGKLKAQKVGREVFIEKDVVEGIAERGPTRKRLYYEL